MKLEDMVLVSIDDHSIRAAGHVQESRGGEVAGPGSESGPQSRWLRRVGLSGAEHLDPVRHGSHSGLASRGMGFQSRSLQRAATRLLRHPRARARHECQRGARLDVLSDHGRLQRPDLHRRCGQRSLAGDAAGLQRLAHRRVVRHLPGPVHSFGDRPDVGRRAGSKGDQAHLP